MMTGAAIDREGQTQGRIVSAIVRFAQLRTMRDNPNMAVITDPMSGETFVREREIVIDVSVALGVPEHDVREAIDAGVRDGVLRRSSHADGYLRADPL